MGTRGPAPTSKEILKLRGSWRANKPGAELRLPVQRPRCPAWLKGEARKLFNQLAAGLEAGGAIALVDAIGLAGLARIGAEVMQRIRELDALQAVKKPNANRIDTVQGILRKSIGDYHKLAAHYGLTPASRSRVHVSDAPEKKTKGVESRDRDKSRFFPDSG